LGVLGLTAFAVAAPAVADRGTDDKKIIICHASGGGIYEGVDISVSALAGHELHAEDIIPPNDGIGARNWDATGIGIHGNSCKVPAAPPVVNQPVENPPVVNQPVENPPVVNQPVVEPQVVTPVVEQSPVVPPAAVVPPPATVVVPEQPAAAQPRAAAPQQAAAAAAAPAATTSLGTNQGYNAQTAVGGSDGAPSWLAGLGALFAAGAAVMLRRKSHSARLAD
jgi:outer membrane biosynthesis protein TonB